MAREPLHAPPGRFRPDPTRGDKRLRRRMFYRRAAFVIGAALCLFVLTPIWKLFGGPLSANDALLIMIGLAVCCLLWMERRKYARCPICGAGVMRPEDVGTVQQKLGIVDHPLFRKNVWTQWYRCSHCSHREWDERNDNS